MQNAGGDLEESAVTSPWVAGYQEMRILYFVRFYQLYNKFLISSNLPVTGLITKG